VLLRSQLNAIHPGGREKKESESFGAVEEKEVFEKPRESKKAKSDRKKREGRESDGAR